MYIYSLLKILEIVFLISCLQVYRKGIAFYVDLYLLNLINNIFFLIFILLDFLSK